MRIISGIRRGHKLKAPDGIDTRPTTDRVKESVFNLIQFCLPAENVLDLFAGSGAMGIEAISRGSANAVFVENSDKALKLVRDNLELVRLTEYANIVKSDAVSYLSRTDEKFDIIFLDPPYNKGMLKPVAEQIALRKILKNDGVIVVETELNGELFEHPSFSLRRRAKYGKTVISVMQYSVEEN